MSSALPIVDVAAVTSDDPIARAALARELGRAAREIGFFLVVGHGVSATLRAEVFAAAATFFALPAADKAALAIDRIGDNRGWVGLAREALDPTGRPDPKEAFNLGFDRPGAPSRNPWPDLPGFRGTMEAWFAAVLDLGRRLHRLLALDLGADPAIFEAAFVEPMATLRLLRYPPTPPRPDRPLGAGAHTDYGCLTLLATDAVGGLEVRRRDGNWLSVPVVADAFVVNIGDCLMRWSNDVYVSTPHRVVAPAGRERFSVAFFLDPSADTLVAALPSCVPAGTNPRHPPVTAAAHLRERFAATYGAVPGDAGPDDKRPGDMGPDDTVQGDAVAGGAVADPAPPTSTPERP